MQEQTLSLWPSLVTVSALLFYLVTIINVGRARVKHKIQPPATSGNPDFERVFRVQQNTLEQLILFLPSLWLFSLWISPLWAGGIGAVWLVGRILFAWGSYQAAEKRTLGFGLTSLATLTLLGGAIAGLVLSLRQFLP